MFVKLEVRVESVIFSIGFVAIWVLGWFDGWFDRWVRPCFQFVLVRNCLSIARQVQFGGLAKASVVGDSQPTPRKHEQAPDPNKQESQSAKENPIFTKIGTTKTRHPLQGRP